MNKSGDLEKRLKTWLWELYCADTKQGIAWIETITSIIPPILAMVVFLVDNLAPGGYLGVKLAGKHILSGLVFGVATFIYSQRALRKFAAWMYRRRSYDKSEIKALIEQQLDIIRPALHGEVASRLTYLLNIWWGVRYRDRLLKTLVAEGALRYAMELPTLKDWQPLRRAWSLLQDLSRTA